jgi:hypothetical protein
MHSGAEICIISLLLSSAVAYLYTVHPPYFDQRMNMLTAAMVWGQAWITFSALIAVITYAFPILPTLIILIYGQCSNDSSVGGPVFMLAILPFVFSAAVMLLRQRCEFLMNCELIELQDPWEFDFRASSLLKKTETRQSNVEHDEEQGGEGEARHQSDHPCHLLSDKTVSFRTSFDLDRRFEAGSEEAAECRSSAPAKFGLPYPAERRFLPENHSYPVHLV